MLITPIPQDPGYHAFVDTRAFLGIPNFNNVVSNIGFVVVGVVGIVTIFGRTGRRLFTASRDARPWHVFFIAVALIGAGSAWYHWAPSNERLFWDRLPMAVAFMAFISAIVADRISSRAGSTSLLIVLTAAGAASLLYWIWTESLGRGDLRFYGFVQFYPVLLLPVICWLFPQHRYTSGRYLVWMFFWYGLAKLFELLDVELFIALGGTVSGHSLKHVAAAAAALVALRMLFVGRSRC